MKIEQIHTITDAQMIEFEGEAEVYLRLTVPIGSCYTYWLKPTFGEADDDAAGYGFQLIADPRVLRKLDQAYAKHHAEGADTSTH